MPSWRRGSGLPVHICAWWTGSSIFPLSVQSTLFIHYRKQYSRITASNRPLGVKGQQKKDGSRQFSRQIPPQRTEGSHPEPWVCCLSAVGSPSSSAGQVVTEFHSVFQVHHSCYLEKRPREASSRARKLTLEDSSHFTVDPVWLVLGGAQVQPPPSSQTPSACCVPRTWVKPSSWYHPPAVSLAPG